MINTKEIIENERMRLEFGFYAVCTLIFQVSNTEIKVPPEN